MLTNAPRISLVTPSFNQGHFLEATLASVLSQNYPNLEYIVMDGGSKDNSVEIIKKHSGRLACWRSEKDKGQYDAINKGFASTTGEIMAWINSDDMYFPWTLRVVSDIMAAFPEVEWLTTLQQGWWDWYGTPLGFGHVPGFSRDAFLDGCYLPGIGPRKLGWIQQESTFWRRSLWERTGARISTDFFMAGDFELWSRFYGEAELYGVSCPIAGFRFQDGQKTKHQEYIRQARVSLDRMRAARGWQDEAPRVKTTRKIASRIPVVKRSTRVKYSGKKISRVDVSTPKAAWKIERYSF